MLCALVRESAELVAGVAPARRRAPHDDFRQLLARGVRRHGGAVGDEVGPAIVAFFSEDGRTGAHARRACDAALQLREEVDCHADALRVSDGRSFWSQLGLSSAAAEPGPVAATALRLAQLAAPGRILLSETTAARIAGGFELRSLGATPFAGSAAPVRVFDLVDHAGRLYRRSRRPGRIRAAGE